MAGSSPSFRISTEYNYDLNSEMKREAKENNQRTRLALQALISSLTPPVI
jgi:hypothetical protein